MGEGWDEGIINFQFPIVNCFLLFAVCFSNPQSAITNQQCIIQPAISSRQSAM